jgi:hypothetical protein
MASDAARAMYPKLAAKEQVEQQPKRDRGGEPEWARSNDPMWSEPRPIPNGLERVPGLVRKVNR